METLQKILQEETEQYVQTLPRGFDDYARIEEELMKNITVRIVNANKNVQKGEPRLTMPKYLDFGQIAQILNAVMTIKVIVDDDSEMRILGIYNGRTYDTNLRSLHLAATALNGRLSRRDLDEMVSRLMLICEEVPVNRDRDLIAVGNGIFNYRTKTLMDFDEKYVFLSCSSVSYRTGGVPLKTFPDGWDVEAWLEEIAADKEVCGLLWETAGSILRPYVHWNKTVWLYSTAGNNGKGTYCELLRNLLGPSACVSIPISDFAKEFALAPLIGKQAIITDENDVGQYIDRVALMKAVVTGDVITINKKYAQPVNYRFRGMMVQCLNEYPKVRDRSDSFYRRQIFVPFEKCFTGRENKKIKAEYLKDPEVLEYVLYKLLNTDYYELSEPAACKAALSDYKETNDPIRQFWVEFEDEFVWDLLPYPFLFDLYKSWYDQNYPRAQQVSRVVFIKAIQTIVMRESIVWGCDESAKKKYRISNRMDKPELLIDQYKLKDWESRSYTGRDMTKRCTLKLGDPLAASYAGLFRKSSYNASTGGMEE